MPHSTDLPQSDARIGVMNGWQTTIRVDVNVRLALNIRHKNKLGLIWELELLEKDENFGWVWAL